MSLKAISVRVNDTRPHVDSVIYNNNILLKVTDGGEISKISHLSQLTDVSSINPQQDDVLIYNTTTSKYENNKLNLDFGEY